jgi:ABC-type multidrug transport system fused ATPase/permease subunit
MGYTTARKVWQLMTPSERRGALGLLGLMIVGMLLETLGIGLVVPALALLTEPEYSRRFPALQGMLAYFGNPSRSQLILGAMVALAVVFLVKNSFLAFLVWRQMRFTFTMPAQLSQRLFAAYLRQPYTFHLRRNSAELLRNVTVDVSILANNAMLPGLILISETLVLLGLCTVLMIFEPLGALAVVSVLGLAAWGFHRLMRRRIERWGLARQHHEGLRIQHLQQGLGGAKDIKVLGREAEFLNRYEVHNVQSARMAQLHSTFQQFPRLWLEVLAVTGLAMLVAVMLAQGSALGDILPTLGLFAAAAFRLMPSANRAIAAAQSLRYGLPVIDTLHAELEASRAPAETRAGVGAPFGRELMLNQVSFTYPGAARQALTDLSLSIACGETVGFIGSSGAGKSTLVDVVLGLLKPDHGEVRVDGVDIASSMRNWQAQIGYVPQSIFLTDESLRSNVAFGLREDHIDDAAVWRALRAAQLEEFVRSLPDGIQTPVGERGVRLSGGQRQRVGIARALYHDPAVLVLDEATSSLDTATERGVMQAVDALHGAKTIVIVAHRLSTVERCDRLYRLEGGRVVEHGTPATMLAVRQSG